MGKDRILVGAGFADGVIDFLRGHWISKRFSLDYDFFREGISKRSIDVKKGFAELPENLSQNKGVQEKEDYWEGFCLRRVVLNDFFLGNGLSLWGSIKARIGSGHIRGYSSDMVLENLRKNIYSGRNPEKIDEKLGWEEREKVERLQKDKSDLADAVLASPERFVLIGKYSQGFMVSPKLWYRYVEPVLVVPGTQDKCVLRKFELSQRRCIEHTKEGKEEYRRIDTEIYSKLVKIRYPGLD